MTTKELLNRVKTGEGLSATDMASIFDVSRMQMHNYLKGNNEIKITVLFKGLQKLDYNLSVLKNGLEE